MNGAVTQDPAAIGRQVVRASLAAMKGRKLPEIINTGYYRYDRHNIDDPGIQSVCYR